MENTHIYDTNITDLTTQIRKLANDNTDAALLLADYNNEKKLYQNGMVEEHDFQEFNTQTEVRLANLQEDLPDSDDLQTNEKISLFLSYNHQDQDTALRIKKFLDPKNIQLRMDISDVKVGQSIQEFILEQTKQNSGIMLLISRNSLASVWVSYESNIAIFNELLNNKRIIPVTLDGSFENNNFYSEACDFYESKIAELDIQIEALKTKGRDPRLLETQRRQLSDASKQLAPILEKLRSIAVFRIDGEHFENRLEQIASQLLS